VKSKKQNPGNPNKKQFIVPDCGPKIFKTGESQTKIREILPKSSFFIV
jgi:hypothetical protein